MAVALRQSCSWYRYAVLLRIVVALGLAACGRVGFDDRAVESGQGSHDLIDGGAQAAPPAAEAYLLSSDATSSTILTLDLATGHLVQVGQLTEFPSLSALAYWDANTLYAIGTGPLVKVTLSPFGATAVPGSDAQGMPIITMQRSGNLLLGFQTTGATANLATTVPGGAFTFDQIQFEDSGGGEVLQMTDGGLAQLSDGTYRLLADDAHFGQLLFTVDSGGGISLTAPQSTTGLGGIGLVRNDADRLYELVTQPARLVPLDASLDTMGNPIGAIALCEDCPTPFPLQDGDVTRAP